MSFKVDATDFDKKFFKLVQKTIPENAKKGLGRGMFEMLNDAKTKNPQCPKGVGDLWGSTAGTVAVKITPRKISVIGGFNSIYATYQHEGERKDGTHKVKEYTKDKGASQPGPKFLQTKMIKYKKKYMGITAKFIENSKV